MIIINHNDHLDFEKIINKIRSKHINLDTTDFQNITNGCSEIHSFVSIKTGENRIKRGLDEILKNEDIQDILPKAKSFLIIFTHSPESQNLLSVEEIQQSHEILNNYFSQKDILWKLAEDNQLKDSVQIIVLAII